MEQGSERRRARRINVRLPVLVSVLIPEISVVPTQIQSQTVDLSERGILVECVLPQALAPFVLGQRRIVRVQFAPDVFPPRLVGLVTWSEQAHKGGQHFHHLGLSFEELDGQTWREWMRFLQSHTSTSLR